MKRFLQSSIVGCALAVCGSAVMAGTISVSPAITSDATSGIEPANAYTHAIGGGASRTVNGVTLDALSPGVTPANFTWTSSTDQSQLVATGGGSWAPGVLAGTEMEALLRDFTFAGGGAAVGQSQTFTLSGLTAGTTYETRLYIRHWDNSTTRDMNLTFTNGAEMDPILIQEDRAEEPPINLADRNDAYYLAYTFTAEGTEMALNAEVAPGGNGSFHMYALTNHPVSGFSLTLDSTQFSSSVSQSDLVGILTGLNTGVPEDSTFALVAGDGSTDNGSFQINGDRLEAGATDFSAFADGAEFSVRVMATGDVSAGTAEAAFILTLTADSDDDGLPDAYEIAVANNLTDLNGAVAGPGPGMGTGDFDGDTLTDLEEYNLSLGAFPNIDPTDADSDDDNLNDGEEIAGAGLRPPTDPTDADTDDDQLTDDVETNTGVFAGATDTGSDPTVVDTDMDGFADGYEVENGGDPVDDTVGPALPDGFAIGILTTDEDSGIDPLLTFTHLVAGGGPATVNGVVFEVLDPAVSPANLVWDTGGFTQNLIGPTINNGDWLPAEGGVTGPGLLDLLGTFTYSGSGANASSAQSFTLQGLTPGETYEARLYIRIWDTEGSGRPVELSFTNGAQTASPTPPGGAPEDRSDEVLGGGSVHAAYAISYTYAAETSEMVIGAKVPDDAPANSGSFHMYGLTNHVAAPPAPFEITFIDHNPAGPSGAEVDLSFNSRPGQLYAVDFSTDLVNWLELTDLVAEGPTTEVKDAALPITKGFDGRLFYRVVQLPRAGE